MKLFNNEKFEKIKNFIIKHHILIILIGAPVFGILGFTGMVVYNQSTSFCLKCHYVKGNYFAIDLRLASHQGIGKGGPGCLKCHPDKAVETLFMRGMKNTKKFSQRAANLQLKEIVNPKDTYKTDECLECHPGRLDVMERGPYTLPDEKLRELGLMLNKRLHYRFESFSQQDQQLYEELSNKGSLAETESNELALLQKIRLGNCGQCHIQKKFEAGEKSVDKQVNFIARNPITCAGCHEQATTLTHPGRPMAFPSKEVCQKCHHGKIHGKFSIFKADCDEQKDTEHCVKCHPYYKEDAYIVGVD
jgi:hypothetical protein